VLAVVETIMMEQCWEAVMMEKWWERWWETRIIKQ